MRSPGVISIIFTSTQHFIVCRSFSVYHLSHLIPKQPCKNLNSGISHPLLDLQLPPGLPIIGLRPFSWALTGQSQISDPRVFTGRTHRQDHPPYAPPKPALPCMLPRSAGGLTVHPSTQIRNPEAPSSCPLTPNLRAAVPLGTHVAPSLQTHSPTPTPVSAAMKLSPLPAPRPRLLPGLLVSSPDLQSVVSKTGSSHPILWLTASETPVH